MLIISFNFPCYLRLNITQLSYNNNSFLIFRKPTTSNNPLEDRKIYHANFQTILNKRVRQFFYYLPCAQYFKFTALARSTTNRLRSLFFKWKIVPSNYKPVCSLSKEIVFLNVVLPEIARTTVTKNSIYDESRRRVYCFRKYVCKVNFHYVWNVNNVFFV